MEDDSNVKGMDQAPASNNSPRRIMTVTRKTLVAADNDPAELIIFLLICPA
jgi:hypothetical protein